MEGTMSSSTKSFVQWILTGECDCRHQSANQCNALQCHGIKNKIPPIRPELSVDAGKPENNTPIASVYHGIHR